MRIRKRSQLGACRRTRRAPTRGLTCIRKKSSLRHKRVSLSTPWRLGSWDSTASELNEGSTLARHLAASCRSIAAVALVLA